jgi:hypothetical protein
MSGHDRFQEMLARRRELGPSERTQLEAHLAGCPDCQGRARAYTEQSAALRTMPQEPAPSVLRARVMTASRNTRPAQTGVRHWFPILAAASAFLLVAGVSLFAWSQRPQGGGGQALKPVTTRPPLVQSTPRVVSRHHAGGHHTRHGSKHPSAKNSGKPRNSTPPSYAPSSLSLAAGSPPTASPAASSNQNGQRAGLPTAPAVTAALLGHHPGASRLKRRPAATAVTGPPQIAAGPPHPTAVTPRLPSAPVAPSSTPFAPTKPPAATVTPSATPSTPIALSLQPGTGTPSPPPPLPAPTASTTP